MRWRVIVGCYLVLLSTALRADVLETLAAREGMAGQFTQEIISPEGEMLERSNGNFALLRPHFFRWEILAPIASFCWLISISRPKSTGTFKTLYNDRLTRRRAVLFSG